MVDGRHARHSVIGAMTQENKVDRTRWAKLLVGMTVSVVVLVACGSDGGSGSSAGTEAAAPEEVTVPDAVVTAGLNQSAADVTALAARVGSGATTDEVDALFEDWEKYEGTVKVNDVETYLALEDAYAAMKSAIKSDDAAAAKQAAADFTSAADAYMAKYP
jgi:ABC-type glycerol-3-phosphate transport system substrate-binding protein